MRTIFVSPEFPLNRRMRKAVRRGKLRVVRAPGERLSLGGGMAIEARRAVRTFSSPLVCFTEGGGGMGGRTQAGRCPIWEGDYTHERCEHARDENAPAHQWLNCAVSPVGDDGIVAVDCPRSGGKYRIRAGLIAEARALEIEKKICLSGWIAEKNIAHGAVPLVDRRVLQEAGGQRNPMPSPAKRHDLALEWFVRMSDPIGSNPAKFHQKELSLAAFARLRPGWYKEENFKSVGEVRPVIANLVEAELLRKKPGEEGLVNAQVTAKGYARSEKLQRPADSPRVFIAMWFGAPGHKERMDKVYNEAIAPAVQAAGYMPDRVDREPHIGRTDDKIIALIRRARFVIADFTAADKERPRGGVYYEAGYARGFGLPVISTCHRSLVGEQAFNTRQYNHILWDDGKLDEFRTELQECIEAEFGKGPE